MDLQEAIRARHSVRRYTDRKIEGKVLEQLEQVVEDCNRESGCGSSSGRKAVDGTHHWLR